MKKTAARLVAGIALAASCTAAGAAHWTEKESTFVADWNVTGTVHIIEMGDMGVMAAGGHTGTVTIQSSQGPVRAFETDCIAFADEQNSGGRCVWTDTLGDQIFVSAQGTGLAGMGRSRGTFVGGTGRYEGIQGGFNFDWNYNVSRGQDATFDGYTLEMRGNYSLQR